MRLPELRDIATAWYRAFRPTPAQQELALERLAVCDTCEFKHWRSSFEEYSCAACGCPLHKKVYSPKAGPEACPHGKWVR